MSVAASDPCLPRLLCSSLTSQVAARRSHFWAPVFVALVRELWRTTTVFFLNFKIYLTPAPEVSCHLEVFSAEWSCSRSTEMRTVGVGVGVDVGCEHLSFQHQENCCEL